jgi:hypothetical protein
MKLLDDLLLINVSQERRVQQLALYASHLATGHSLFCLHLKAATIRQYLLAVAKFIARFAVADPRFAQSSDKSLAEPIRAVLHEVERLEGIPNKVEPYTLTMQHHLEGMLTPDTDIDGELACCIDWFNNGLLVGYRLSEYGQKEGHRRLDSPAVDEQHVPIAFCLEDLNFFDEVGRKLSLDVFILHPDSVIRIQLRFTHQKNKNHGEQKLFVRNVNNPPRCFVATMARIVHRFLRLVGRRTGIPLAVYKRESEVIYLTEGVIAKHMKSLACAVYNLDPTKDTVRFSSHSLRVGACVILHANAFTASQIKFLLRWKSDAFMEYLRNVAVLSNQQNSAVDLMDHMPNLI